MIDPIEQFNIDNIFTIGHIGNQQIAFTNSSAYMFGSVALISLLMIGGVAGRHRPIDQRGLFALDQAQCKGTRRSTEERDLDPSPPNGRPGLGNGDGATCAWPGQNLHRGNTGRRTRRRAHRTGRRRFAGRLTAT